MDEIETATAAPNYTLPLMVTKLVIGTLAGFAAHHLSDKAFDAVVAAKLNQTAAPTQ